jgi:hypothetical protein
MLAAALAEFIARIPGMSTGRHGTAKKLRGVPRLQARLAFLIGATVLILSSFRINAGPHWCFGRYT